MMGVHREMIQHDHKIEDDRCKAMESYLGSANCRQLHFGGYDVE